MNITNCAVWTEGLNKEKKRMNIILELSTGKEIKLTTEEYEEIKGIKLKEVRIPYQRTYYPYWETPWIAPTVTYADGTACSKGE